MLCPEYVERMLERIILRLIDVNEHVIAALGTGREDDTTRLTCRDSLLLLAPPGAYDSDFAQRIAASAGLRTV